MSKRLLSRFLHSRESMAWKLSKDLASIESGGIVCYFVHGLNLNRYTTYAP